jgi:hypothetical protein
MVMTALTTRSMSSAAASDFLRATIEGFESTTYRATIDPRVPALRTAAHVERARGLGDHCDRTVTMVLLNNGDGTRTRDHTSGRPQDLIADTLDPDPIPSDHRAIVSLSPVAGRRSTG